MTTLQFKSPTADGRSQELSGSLDDAVAKYHEDGVILLSNVIDPEVLGDIALTDPDLYENKTHPEFGRYFIDRGRYVEALYQSKIFSFLYAALQTDILIVPVNTLTHLRPQSPVLPSWKLPLHQDGHFVGNALITRLWFQLYPETCGIDVPNVEYVVGNKHDIYALEEAPESESYAQHEMAHQARDKVLSNCPRWAPEVGRGDVVVFSGFTPHRTNFPAGVSGMRVGMHSSVCAFNGEAYDYYTNRHPDGAFIAFKDGLRFVGTSAAREAVYGETANFPVIA